jgi:hypothetical protein
LHQAPDELDMHVIYDVSHNIAKVPLSPTPLPSPLPHASPSLSDPPTPTSPRYPPYATHNPSAPAAPAASPSGVLCTHERPV